MESNGNAKCFQEHNNLEKVNEDLETNFSDKSQLLDNKVLSVHITKYLYILKLPMCK